MTIPETRIVPRTIVVAVAVMVMLTTACGPGRATMPGAIAPSAGASVRVRTGGRVVSVPLERYVLGAVLSEITPTGETPATAARVYETQSVIARTYAVAHAGRHAAEGFDLCDTTHCQVYQPDRIRTSSFSAIAERAVTQTRGDILRVGQTVIDALFHADCGGHTTTPAAAWAGTDYPYLPARQDQLPGLTHRTWSFEAGEADWRTILNSDPRTAVGAAIRTITVASVGPGDRVTSVRLVGARERIVTGEVFRSVVSAVRGARSVMSTRFTVHRTPVGFRLVGSGFGHGVGLCQVGAIARARRGDSLAAILGHYYPGTGLRPSS